jgi:demethylmenaquinone methyltransferase/2-methoxy-6-polyprenyl-1,4-benzoquinol methylase
MLAAARARIARADLEGVVELREARAESLPFEDAVFDALTFTYLLRYVDDPGATLRELARVVRPGGRIAMLEFHVPSGGWRPLWELYVRAGLPALGRLAGRGWYDVGRFLGPSIRGLYERLPLERLLELWREAGIEDPRARTLSLGGGVVVWGTRGD